jgi:hypothetical protein
MVSCGCAAQRALWPPVAVQPNAGYGLLWLCSPTRAMASCGCAAQRGLWPPVAVHPNTGYGLLWLCSPTCAMASCGCAAQRALWPPRSGSFLITHNEAPQSVGLFWTSDQPVAETSTWQHTTNTTDKHPCLWWHSNPRSQQARSRRPTLRLCGHWDQRYTILYTHIIVSLYCIPIL